jgi:hypothetical protein
MELQTSEQPTSRGSPDRSNNPEIIKLQERVQRQKEKNARNQRQFRKRVCPCWPPQNFKTFALQHYGMQGPCFCFNAHSQQADLTALWLCATMMRDPQQSFVMVSVADKEAAAMAA